MEREYKPGRMATWIAACALAAVWLLSWGWILTRARSVLPFAPADPLRFLVGELVVGLTIVALLWLSRRSHHEVRPRFARSEFRAPVKEAILTLLYLAALIVFAQIIGIRPHIASLGLTDQTMMEWRTQTASSLLLWAGYFGLFGALLPLLFYRFVLGYSFGSLLLRWPRPTGRWIVYALATGAIGIGGFAGPDFLETPVAGHVATALIFTAGTFLPVMVLTQCILAPRLVALSGSLTAGAALTGFAYALYHATEFYLEWSSLEAATTSLAWLAQFALFGFFKAVTTLRTGSACLHIFNTHLPHLAEAPQVALCLGIR